MRAVQPPPYPPPSPPGPPPPRRVGRPLVAGLVVGALVLVLVAVGVAVVLSRRSASHTVRGSLQFRKVTAMTPAPCAPGDTARLTSADGCYELGDGMTVSRVRDVELRSPGASQGSVGYSVVITLDAGDATRLAALTTEVAREQEPRNRLAIVIDRKLASAPTVAEPITGGAIMLTGGYTRAEARRYVDLLGG
jgi:hypothetical protein